MCDATHENIAHLPPGQSLGYSTGTETVKWTQADWAAHPGAVRLDQSPTVEPEIDAASDGDDYENSAVTLGELAPRAHQRIAAFKAGTRPGQRRPIVYCSRVNVHDVADALIAGGIKGTVTGFGGLGVADWNNDLTAARDEVANASGPFPIVWRQYANMGTFDAGVASVPWLTTTSAAPPPPPQHIIQSGWRWCHKCQSLFYGPNQARSRCAAGGTHDLAGSGDYSLSVLT
jgi:hypothetical protein